eukprot:UN05318
MVIILKNTFSPLLLNLLSFPVDQKSPVYTHNLLCLAQIYHHFSNGYAELQLCPENESITNQQLNINFQCLQQMNAVGTPYPK